MSLGDVDVLMISSNMELIEETLNDGGPNPLCADAERRPPASAENQRTLGALFTFAGFTFVDLGRPRLGHGDEALLPGEPCSGRSRSTRSSRHGAFDGAGAPAHLYAMRPQVVVVNNGPRKGITAPHMYDRITAVPDIEGIWQTHLALEAEGHNTDDDMIANFEDTDDCQGHWLRCDPSRRTGRSR